VDYIEDGIEGKSYLKTTELIENAKFSVIAVGYWEPFPHYSIDNTTDINSGISEAINARRKYYIAMKKQIDLHQKDEEPFHRRIIQVPEEYMTKRIPFEVDPIFKDYLLFVAKTKDDGYRSCVLRKSKVFIKADFILIDDQYIVLPVLTTIKNVVQA